jgi:hypothetical protein
VYKETDCGLHAVPRRAQGILAHVDTLLKEFPPADVDETSESIETVVSLLSLWVPSPICSHDLPSVLCSLLPHCTLQRGAMLTRGMRTLATRVVTAVRGVASTIGPEAEDLLASQGGGKGGASSGGAAGKKKMGR